MCRHGTPKVLMENWNWDSNLRPSAQYLFPVSHFPHWIFSFSNLPPPRTSQHSIFSFFPWNKYYSRKNWNTAFSTNSSHFCQTLNTISPSSSFVCLFGENQRGEEGREREKEGKEKTFLWSWLHLPQETELELLDEAERAKRYARVYYVRIWI